MITRNISQKHRDQNRRTYRLHFPAELNSDQVVSWMRSISGTLRVSRSRLRGVPTVAFEMWATPEGIARRLKVPWQYADYVVSQVRSLVPGIRLTPEDEFPRREWTRGRRGSDSASRALGRGRVNAQHEDAADLLGS